MNVSIRNNLRECQETLDRSKTKALTKIGIAAVQRTINFMNTRYYKDIWLTGDLQRDVNSKVDQRNDSVSIGNSLEYGILVHNGTTKMPSRPYLKDAILENANTWKEITEQILKLEYGQ